MKKTFMLVLLSASLLFFACQRQEDYSVPVELLKEWRMDVVSAKVIPTLQGRADTGDLIVQVRDDRTVVYQYNVHTFADNDYVQGGGIYFGNAQSNGPLMLNFVGRSSARVSSGILTNLRQSLIDSLLDSRIPKYVQLHSTRVPSGFARANLN